MNRLIVGLTVCFLLVPGLLRADPDPPVDPVVHVADKKDDTGAWIWTEQLPVTWHIDPLTSAQVGNHNPVDDDTAQDWYIPYMNEWWRFTFARDVMGEYAIRWKHSDSGWSRIETCTIRPPEAAKHKDPAPTLP